jgi:hypothetical protein
MVIESRVSRGIVAFSLATVICAAGALCIGVGLALLVSTGQDLTEFTCPLVIGGGMLGFVGIGLLPCVAAKLYEQFGTPSPPKSPTKVVP